MGFDQYKLTGDRLLEEQLNALLKGHIKPPSSEVAHAIKRANETSAAGNELAKELQTLDQKRNRLVEMGLRLNGARDSYHDDIKAWLVDHADHATATEEPPDAS